MTLSALTVYTSIMGIFILFVWHTTESPRYKRAPAELGENS